MAKADLTAQRLRELLHYDPETGVFTRRVSIARAREGQKAGACKGNGYLVIRIDYRLHLAHRLAWLYMTGAWPTSEIDHINGIRDDNRFINIRIGALGFNQQNIRRAQNNNSSGFLGVERYGCRWVARIMAKGIRTYLGSFKTPELAHAAYLKAKRELHEGCTI